MLAMNAISKVRETWEYWKIYEMILGDIGNLWDYIYNTIMTCSYKEEILIDNRSVYKGLYYYNEHIDSYYNKKGVEKWRLWQAIFVLEWEVSN